MKLEATTFSTSIVNCRCDIKLKLANTTLVEFEVTAAALGLRFAWQPNSSPLATVEETYKSSTNPCEIGDKTYSRKLSTLVQVTTPGGSRWIVIFSRLHCNRRNSNFENQTCVEIRTPCWQKAWHTRAWGFPRERGNWLALKNGMFFLSRNVFEIGLRKGLSGGGERCEVQSVCPSRSCGPQGMIRHDVCHQHILSEWCRACQRGWGWSTHLAGIQHGSVTRGVSTSGVESWQGMLGHQELAAVRIVKDGERKVRPRTLQEGPSQWRRRSVETFSHAAVFLVLLFPISSLILIALLCLVLTLLLVKGQTYRHGPPWAVTVGFSELHPHWRHRIGLSTPLFSGSCSEEGAVNSYLSDHMVRREK